MLHAFCPECLCVVSPLQAERFITAICSFYHCHLSLYLSVYHCVFTQDSSACLYTCFFLTCMFCSCSIISVRLMMLDNPFIPYCLLQSWAFSSQHCHLLWHEDLNNGLILEEAPAVGRWRWSLWPRVEVREYELLFYLFHLLLVIFRKGASDRWKPSGGQR